MTKTPTAEEVLGLYLKWNKTEEEFDEFRMQCRDEGEVHDFAMDVISDKEKFEAALDEWHAAQGPVTREWFVERFGASDIDQSIHGWTMHISLRGRVEIGLHDEYGEVYLELHNPTRADIETLVRVLGGENHGKEA